MHSYEQIFRRRADAYQQAMTLIPTAREREFRLAVEAARIKPGDVVCDAPAGGGYLRAYLPPGIGRYLAVETAPDFIGHCQLGDNDRIIESPLDRIELEDSSVDVCINLAGSHHLEDKRAFFREAARILKPGGRLVLADVEAGTDVDRFLNVFVDAHNSMGHTGIFLTGATADEIAACGFEIEGNAVESFAWVFPNRSAVGTFCKLLFGMDKAGEDEVLGAAEEILGLKRDPGAVNMTWSLRFITAVLSHAPGPRPD